MPDFVTVNIGGVSFSLFPDKFTGNYQLPDFIEQFISTTPHQIELKIHCGSFPKIKNPILTFETVQGWKIYTSDSRNIITLTQRDLDPYLVGVFSPDFRSGDIHVARIDQNTDTYAFPLTYPMGELLMMNLLGDGSGMLFHASGVIYQGQGYLFTGHGGIGKTTTARLWATLPDARVVNDDKVIVRQENGQFWMYGTPWPGEGKMALPEKAQLKQVFILKQAQHNTLKSLQPAVAAGMLMARTFLPLWDSKKVSASLGFLDQLIHQVPCRELGFLPDMSAVEFVFAQ